MPFKKATTWEERMDQVQQVRHKCNQIIGKLGLANGDARKTGMIHVRQLCNTLAAVPIMLQMKAEKKIYARTICEILGIQSGKDLKACLCDFNKNSKCAFITVVQFALENCIVQVIKGLGETEKHTFRENAKNLIGVTSLLEPAKKQDIVMVPAWIRNSLHANGIHTKSDKKVPIDDVVYVFRKNRRIDCGSWSHILHAILHSLDIYSEIFLSSRVGVIEHIKSV